MKNSVPVLLIILFGFTPIFAQPTIDGDLSDAQYVSLATKTTSNIPFAGLDITEIVYFADVANSKLYLGVKCELNNATNDGIGLWLNFSSLTGFAAGTSLGTTGAAHYMSGDGSGGNVDFMADFEVDYMFSLDPNLSASCFVDAVKFPGGSPSVEFLGDCGQLGNSTTNSTGGIFSQNSVEFAFQNGGGSQGFEISFPFVEFNASSSDNFSAFAFIVTNDASFDDVTVPGNVSPTGDLGTNPDFNSISGGPFHTTPDVSLPVTLASFNAYGKDGEVLIRWTTHSEVDNDMFIIDRSTDGQNFAQLAQIPGAGNTNTTKRYSITDPHVINGVTYYYRLADRDFSGNITYHNIVSATPKAGIKIIEIDPDVPEAFRLYPNFPNPFNPKTTIRFDLSSKTMDEQFVNLSIYNTSGQKIKTLINQALANKSYEVDWDGANDNGVQVSSGIYLYRLSTPDFVSTKKLMLIR